MKIKIKNILKFGITAIQFLIITPTTLANNLQSIPSVFQLKAIEQTDWNYQTLQSLAQKYNCDPELIANKNSPLTRYEFAVGINNCWQKLETISNRQDSIAWRRLQQNFASELARLRKQTDRIATSINQLESQQFSTTTKLNGQVLFFIADSFTAEDTSQTLFGYRIRLDFDTSFNAKDLLKIRFESREIGGLDDVTDTLLTRLSVDGNSDNSIEIAELSYTFTPIENTSIVLGTTGVGLNDIGEVLNPFSSSSRGAISRFARRNPATLRGAGGAGIGIKHKISDRINIGAGYLVNSDSIANPEAGNGLFASSYSAIAQIVIEPQDELAFAITYTHTYESSEDVNLMGSTGLEDSNQPFGDNATTADNLGLQFNWAISDRFELGGWFGYTRARQQTNGDATATILNGALTLAFPDLGWEDNMGGIIIGVPPAIANHDDDNLIAEETPLQIEALYRIQIDPHLEITPGVFAIINPDTNDGNTIWVGAIRTYFSF